MSKILAVFLCFSIFIVGLSLGIYFSTSSIDDEVTDKGELTRQIQDIVIEQVQASQKDFNDVKEVNTDAKTRISPYAKIIVEKYYKLCGHTTIDIIDVPKELINFTEEEFKNKYNKWEVKSFDSKEISIYREIDANCSSHFVIKDSDGYLSIYNQITDDILELKQKTDIEIASLREDDRVAIINGIEIYRKR